MPRANVGSSRISQLSSSAQAKDIPLSNSKVSEETNFGIFDLAKFSKKSALPCDICMRCDTVLNRIFVCSSCKVLCIYYRLSPNCTYQLLTLCDQQAAVHLDCYQSLKYPTGPWICELCQEMPLDSVISGNQSDCNGAKAFLVQCGLCHGTSGAFRKTLKGQWVHAFCAEVMICVPPL